MRHRFLPQRRPVSLLGVSGLLLVACTWGASTWNPVPGAPDETARAGAVTADASSHDAPPAPASAEAIAPGDGDGPAPVVGAALEELNEEAPREAALLYAEEALGALGAAVTRSSHPEALRTAFEGYFRHRDAHPGEVTKPYLYFVDLGLDNGTARGWVFDMESLEVVEGPFTVAHGRGSARQRNGVPTSFSNRPGSKASSLGLYLAQETYTFRGKSGGRAYRSVGLRLEGESGSFNDQARRRGIVAHGAPYVTARSAGRSEGCPAMEPARAERLLPLIANGGVVFLYSPNDERWLTRDPWVGGARLAAGRSAAGE